MPSLEHNGATIYYEVFGQGFPILTFAPAGLQSVIDVWNRPSAPVNPITAFSDNFQVIAMDQRNAGGRSRAPITARDNWDSYTSDHIAVLDHLGIEQYHLYGQCIGGPFIFNLIKAQPQRVACAVIAQTIGRVGDMAPGRTANFEAWVQTLKDRPDATEEVLDQFYHNLYDPGFVYCVDRDFVANCQIPCLVLAGNDAAHPLAISEEVAQLLPNAEFIREWKEGEALVAVTARMKQFLLEHTPVRT